jgi:hypothetical protein
MRLRIVCSYALLACAPALAAQGTPSLPAADRTRLAEAFRLADAIGDRIWPEWTSAPFAVLLVTAEHEFLLRHPRPSPDFTALGYDSVLKSQLYVRPRQLDPAFLATFPAVGGVWTIVIGEAQNTMAKTSTPWVVTLLHEHFHQLQYSRPGYADGVLALGLAHGNQSGMWMLNYPFPYADSAVQRRFSTAARALLSALDAHHPPGQGLVRAAFRQTNAAFMDSVDAESRKYFSFQLWQEGIARYTEVRVAEFASASYQPGAAFSALADFTPYRTVREQLMAAIEAELANEKLGEERRIVVYNYGAAEGLVLDLAVPGWRSRYFAEPFALEAYFGR